MAVQIIRGNVPAVTRPNTVATVGITVDVTALIARVQAGDITLAQAKLEALRSAHGQLGEAIQAQVQTDEQLDAAALAYTAEVTRVKSLRPTGSL